MDLISQLVRDEGEVLHAYQDSLGFWTIGSGILIDARKGGGITHEENMYLTANRVTKADAAVKSKFPWASVLDPIRYAVLVNMAYNMGIDHLLGFHHMLDAMQAGNWSEAAAQGRASAWHSQVGARAERLMKQLETGEWQ